MSRTNQSAKVSDIDNDFAKTQIAVFFVIILLAVDSINPIKVFLHVFPQVAPWHVASISFLLMIYVFISEMKQLLYFSVKIFFHSILSIFFRDVDIVGAHHIPVNGPVIFTSNHANQFIDSVVILSTCQRTISYLIAEKSWSRPIVGNIAWAMSAVPVKRALDSTMLGSGSISITELEDIQKKSYEASYNFDENYQVKLSKVTGTETKFSKELKCNDKIQCHDHNRSIPLKVVEIFNDESMIVEWCSLPKADIPSSLTTYDIMKCIDQKVVYEKVLEKLLARGAIGIFPEGESNDRTDLLPLKAGVALIAHSAMEKYGLNVPIVPVGLNYFRGHHFRGRVIVEYGKPTYVDSNTMTDYLKGGSDKRRVCSDFLERVADNMRGVIVSAPDYESLQVIHTARRLYKSGISTSSEKQDLSRRFAEGYKKLFLMTDGNPPKEWLDLQDRIKSYQKDLKKLGIRDYQVPGLASVRSESYGDTFLRFVRIPYRIVELLLLVLVSFVPALFLNLPVGLIASLWANKRRRTFLAMSKVKLKALDVVLSEKVLMCIVLVPSLWIAYGLALYFFTDLDGPAIALAISSLPLFSYMGIVTAEAGMVDFKDLLPFFQQLFPSTRRRLLSLPSIRNDLQKDLLTFIRMIGPSLGDVYTEKSLDWAEVQKSARGKLVTQIKTRGKVD